MVNLAKRLTSAISIGNNVVLDATDFEIIWRWLFYCKIIEDNKENNYGIFINDEKWSEFEKKISLIGYEKKKHFLSIPSKVLLSCPITDYTQQTSFKPALELDLLKSKVEETENYKLFVKIIDETVFKRDLRLIRDLVIVVKKFNQIFARKKCEDKSNLFCPYGNRKFY